jgi:hypothetical protein
LPIYYFFLPQILDGTQWQAIASPDGGSMENKKPEKVKDTNKKDELSEEDLKQANGGVKDESVDPYYKAPHK